jgi:hypothetical protein
VNYPDEIVDLAKRSYPDGRYFSENAKYAEGESPSECRAVLADWLEENDTPGFGRTLRERPAGEDPDTWNISRLFVLDSIVGEGSPNKGDGKKET